MISKLKKLYPSHLLFNKKGDKIFDIDNNEIKKDCLPKKQSYIIFSNNFYEVHNKRNIKGKKEQK